MTVHAFAHLCYPLRTMTTSINAVLAAALLLTAPGVLRAQPASFTVTVVPPVHGKVQLTPALPADGKYPAGTVVTVTTTPDPGYALDSAWYSVPGRFGQMYHEGMTPQFKVTIDQDKRIGASFIEAAAVKDLVVTHDVVFAKPGVKPLKYDVYTPEGRAEPADDRHRPRRRLDRQRRRRDARPRPRADQGRPVRGGSAWTTAGPARPMATPPATRWPT